MAHIRRHFAINERMFFVPFLRWPCTCSDHTFFSILLGKNGRIVFHLVISAAATLFFFFSPVFIKLCVCACGGTCNYFGLEYPHMRRASVFVYFSIIIFVSSLVLLRIIANEIADNHTHQHTFSLMIAASTPTSIFCGLVVFFFLLSFVVHCAPLFAKMK